MCRPSMGWCSSMYTTQTLTCSTTCALHDARARLCIAVAAAAVYSLQVMTPQHEGRHTRTLTAVAQSPRLHKITLGTATLQSGEYTGNGVASELILREGTVSPTNLTHTKKNYREHKSMKQTSRSELSSLTSSRATCHLNTKRGPVRTDCDLQKKTQKQPRTSAQGPAGNHTHR